MMRLAAAALLVVACGGSPQEPVAGDFHELPADNVMTNVEFRPTSNGVRSAILRSDTVYAYEDSAEYKLVGVDLEIFDESGRRTATLTSERGEFNTATEAMVALGNVVLITVQDERRVETEELHYDPSSRQIWSDVPTVMHTKDGPQRGTSFRADDQFQRVQVIGFEGKIPGLRMEF
ncbi:MAG: LPS export ABC transporter periplasmic protein LptC [Longimicrobiales bacterium]